MKWMLLGCAVVIAGCGTTGSSVPVYPAGWPALIKSKNAPDLSGTYRAVSDPVGPLVYPRGGRPREIFFFVPVGEPERNATFGRRILPWHLAGLQGSNMQEQWGAIKQFAGEVEPDAEHPEGREEGGWVKVAGQSDGEIRVECGVKGESRGRFVLAPAGKRPALAGLWSNPRGYRIEDGGVKVVATFPVPEIERDGGVSALATGSFTFYRAADGSLVMLENLFGAPSTNTLVFQKWWRWRPVQAR